VELRDEEIVISICHIYVFCRSYVHHQTPICDPLDRSEAHR
jgi:hypothetical protein